MIGVYEHACVILPDGTEYSGSVLTLSEQLEAPGRIALHDRCGGPFERTREQRREASG